MPISKKALRIGVLGAGHLGKIHLNCLKMLPDQYELVGFHDADPTRAAAIAQEMGITAFPTYDALLAAVEVVDIVTPTLSHFDNASAAMRAGKHVFIEKPVTETVDEARRLMLLLKKHPVKVQIGHVERFNPAMEAIRGHPLKPMFIEAHRLAHFNPRGTDVSVVLDLMIHDIDLVLHLVKSDIKKINASGVCIVSNTPDIANARIEFRNGCVANLTASRMSMKVMRKMRVFQPDAYISLDFYEKNAQIIRIHDKKLTENLMPLDTPTGTKWIDIQMPETPPVNAIREELSRFAHSIQTDTPTEIDLEAGHAALKVAHQILKMIKK
jgi:predicted dehydrogenase